MKDEIHHSISSQRERERERHRDVNDGERGGIAEEVDGTSSSTTMLSFQDGITTVLIETEELRRRINSISSSSSSSCFTNDDCFQILHDLEELLARLYSPQLAIDDESNNSCNNDSSRSNSISSRRSRSNNKSKNETEIEIELRKHCLQKTTYVAMLALKLITTTTTTTRMSSSSPKNRRQQGKQEPDPEDDNYRADEERDCQSAIARIAELNLVLCCDNCDDDDNDVEGKTEDSSTTKKSIDEIINIYSSYQRQVIRQRSKPSIARLVEHRKRHKQMMGITFTNGGANKQQVMVNNVDNEDGDEENDGNYYSSSSKQHIKVLTTILGQATSLIHPLMMWGSNLPQSSALYKLCTQSIQTLDEQAQSLANTVATWFMEDSQIDSYWMTEMSGGVGGERNNNNEGHYSSSDRTTTGIDLGELDSVVDQLAFCCQIFDRYIQLVVVKENETTKMTILQQLHPEWTWKYASLERYLTTQQLRSALHPSNNFPVEIVVGAKIQVPSFVEDGTYLSTRALKRAASTRSDQAIGTVAHSIASDVWSTDTDNNDNNNNNAGTNNHGIYEALVEQRGCYNPTNSTNNDVSSSADGIDNNTPKGSSTSSNSNSFAQALLGALDEDPSSSTKPTASIVKSTSSPNSGGLLGTISSFGSVGGGDDKFLQIRLATHICALNGLHSASIACSSLVEFLDSLLIPDHDHDGSQKKGGGGGGGNSMVHLAREELFRYSKNYQDLLQTQIVKIVTEFCGSLKDDDVPYGRNNHTNIIPVLRYNLERESYNLPNAQYLANAEEDTRLYKILIQPINDCQLFHQFDKCDAAVLRLLCQETARVLCELFLNILLPTTSTTSSSSSTTTNPKKKKMFTDWGSLLFSKEVRLIQNHLQALMQQAVSTAAMFSHEDDQAHSSILMSQQWERLSQAVTILQLEKPSDWLSYNTYHQSQPKYTSSGTSTGTSTSTSTSTSTAVLLSTKELYEILSLRVDFSRDAINRVVASIDDK